MTLIITLSEDDILDIQSTRCNICICAMRTGSNTDILPVGKHISYDNIIQKNEILIRSYTYAISFSYQKFDMGTIYIPEVYYPTISWGGMYIMSVTSVVRTRDIDRRVISIYSNISRSTNNILSLYTILSDLSVFYYSIQASSKSIQQDFYSADTYVVFLSNGKQGQILPSTRANMCMFNMSYGDIVEMNYDRIRRSFVVGRDLAMTSYTLGITLKPEDIDHIRTLGQNINLTKVSGSSLDAAWVSITPDQLAQSIGVTWTEVYGIFANRSTVSEGTTIVFGSKKDNVKFGTKYKFDANFTEIDTCPANQVQVYEANPNQPWSIGMYQTTSVNGTDVQSALGASNVGTNMTTTMTPKETIYVYIGSQTQNDALKISTVGACLQVTYDGPGVHNIGFNSKNNTFYILSHVTAAPLATVLLNKDNNFRANVTTTQSGVARFLVAGEICDVSIHADDFVRTVDNVSPGNVATIRDIPRGAQATFSANNHGDRNKANVTVSY